MSERDIRRYAGRFPIQPEDWFAIDAAVVRDARTAGRVRRTCADFAGRMAERGVGSEWPVAEDIVLLEDGRLWHVIEDEEASDWWVVLRQREIENSLARLEGGELR